MVPKKYLILFSILLSMVGTKALAYDIAVENTDGVTIYYNYINDGKELEVTSGKSYAGVVVIPEEVTYMSRTRKVRSIGESAFFYCTALTSIEIPNSVTSIGVYAFYECSGLTSIEIPNSVTSIGKGAFCQCFGLTSITIPNNVTSIGEGAFSYCSSLTYFTVDDTNTKYKSVDGILMSKDGTILVVYPEGRTETTFNIPNSVTSIGVYAFYGCSGLTSVTIPNSVTSIGVYAFCGCSGLTSVTIPNSVMSIGERAFGDCSGLTSITIPNSVTSIGEGAFSYCRSLTSITVDDTNTKYKSVDGVLFSKDGTALIAYPAGNTENSYNIPNSVTSIGVYAFYDCESLTSIEIPNSVTSIGEGAFYRCFGLTSITIPNGVTSIETYTFKGCGSLTSIEIPSSVTSIGKEAFYGCRLTSVTIPNNVTSIGVEAFNYCEILTSVTIPESVTSIGGWAFSYSHILEVISKIRNPFNIEASTFSNYSFHNATLYVPEGTIEKYKATEGWKNFANIEEGNGGGDTPPEQSKCEKPTISYQNGKLIFSCATEGVTYQYNITASSIKSGEGNDVDFTPKYSITAYATKDGYENSDTATLEISVSGGVNGDINGDGFVNAADVVKLVNIIMGQ